MVKEPGSILLRIIDEYARRVLEIVEEKGPSGLKKEKPRLLRETGEALAALTAEASRAKIALARKLLDEQARGLLETGYTVVVIDAQLRDRGLVGAGGGLLASVLEMGLAWDLLLDLPYVPGSSFKGAVSAFAEALVGCDRPGAECRDTPRKRAAGELTALRTLFGESSGSGGSMGSLLFLDGYPVEPGRRGALVAPAVITPHYHRGGEPCRYEYEAKPVPVQHIVLASGTVFRFIVAFPLDRADEVAGALRTLGLRVGNGSAAVGVAALIASALEKGGIGARTTKGYGVFRLVSVHAARPRTGA
ncbi:MAG TPA: type III-B CRISPR module RAMP protein Cmr6 [Pyrodictium sp.]|nr:type III-B CRISPR module RAMP protein Cmr6 [Pyrodictium sp.]